MRLNWIVTVFLSVTIVGACRQDESGTSTDTDSSGRRFELKRIFVERGGDPVCLDAVIPALKEDEVVWLLSIVTGTQGAISLDRDAMKRVNSVMEC